MIDSHIPRLAAPVTYIPKVFDGYHFNTIDASLPWKNYGDAPRDECFMSAEPALYTYGRGAGVRTYASMPFTQTIADIRRALQTGLGAGFDLMFANKYEDQTKHLGWHADDADTIDHKYGIAIVSFGAERKISFRSNPLMHSDHITVDPVVESLVLGHGSVCLMRAGMQQTHQHKIPKHDQPCGPRISLTFRTSKA